MLISAKSSAVLVVSLLALAAGAVPKQEASPSPRPVREKMPPALKETPPPADETDRERDSDRREREGRPDAEPAQGARVSVRLTATGIEAPEEAPPGILSFILENADRRPRGLVIEGPGVTERTEAPLQPGETRMLKVHLRPGEYVLRDASNTSAEVARLRVAEPQTDRRSADPEVSESQEKYAYPLIAGHGGIVHVPNAAVPPRAGAKVVFDITGDGGAGKVTKGLDRVALFLNLATDFDVRPEELELVLVLHGDATKAALSNAAYARHTGRRVNPNARLLETLAEHGVELYVCAQALAHHGYGQEEVAGPVKIAASAATVNVAMQMDGYAYIPF